VPAVHADADVDVDMPDLVPGEDEDEEDGDNPVKKKARKVRVARVFNKLAKVHLSEEELVDFRDRVLVLAHGDALKHAETMLDKWFAIHGDEFQGSLDLILSDPPWQVTKATHDKDIKSKVPQLAESMFGALNPRGTVLIRVSWQLAPVWWEALNDAGFKMEAQLLIVAKTPKSCVYRSKLMKYRANAHYYYVVGHKTSNYYEADASGGWVLENEYPHLASIISNIPPV
jgi:hypothetical protein